MIDQSAALAAHNRLRTALVVAAAHRMPDDEDDPPQEVHNPRERGRWRKWTRPGWLPAIGERCVIVGWHFAGLHGVAATMRGNRNSASMLVHGDDGRKRYVLAEFVAREGTPVPAVPIRRRDKSAAIGYIAGDRPRITGGPREGMVVTYMRLAGQHAPGVPNIRVLLPGGGVGTVLARLVERA